MKEFDPKDVMPLKFHNKIGYNSNVVWEIRAKNNEILFTFTEGGKFGIDMGRYFVNAINAFFEIEASNNDLSVLAVKVTKLTEMNKNLVRDADKAAERAHAKSIVLETMEKQLNDTKKDLERQLETVALLAIKSGVITKSNDTPTSEAPKAMSGVRFIKHTEHISERTAIRMNLFKDVCTAYAGTENSRSKESMREWAASAVSQFDKVFPEDK